MNATAPPIGDVRLALARCLFTSCGRLPPWISWLVFSRLAALFLWQLFSLTLIGRLVRCDSKQDFDFTGCGFIRALPQFSHFALWRSSFSNRGGTGLWISHYPNAQRCLAAV